MWCGVDDPLFDPFQELSSGAADAIERNIELMRQPMRVQ